MTEADYIAEVCRQNPLSETAAALLLSDEDFYYADRHIERPPAGLPSRAACIAGLALLRQWAADATSLADDYLQFDEPILLIDQEWLDELPDAPPAHVYLTIAKRGATLSRFVPDGESVAHSDCPIHDLLVGEFAQFRTIKIAPNAERESLGCWLFRFA